MREKMQQMQQEVQEIMSYIRENLAPAAVAGSRSALVRVPGSKLVRSRAK
jgi:hypothetical protein